jgi:integrative and conjugative element protein (TIGR02256 family)
MILRFGMRLVDVADEVVETMERYSWSPENGREAGGILIGSYRGPHVEILHCTVPLPTDGRYWGLFDRRDPGHREDAMRRWHESGRKLTYVGEWHTHPEPIPFPSCIDKTTWKRAAKRNRVGPTVFIIRGTEGWWWGMMQATAITTLIPILDP